jgi:prepilin-type processing-associated H-X9-DG protein
MKRLSAHSGFSRIDLLVLLTIIALVAALTVPAVQSARETANRAACANHLKQLAQAAHQYCDVEKSLPPGWWGGGPAINGPLNGPFPQLLPYLGAKPLFDKFARTLVWDPKTPTSDYWDTLSGQAGYNYATLAAAAMPLTFMQCPADYDSPLTPDQTNTNGDPRQGHPRYLRGSWTVSLNNGGKAGDPKTSNAVNPLAVNWGQSAEGEWVGNFLNNWYDHDTDAYCPFGRVNYMPVAGLGGGKSPFYSQFEGVFTDRTNQTLAAIAAADGTARTLMFGETTGQFYPTYGEHALQINLFSATGQPTMRGLQQRCAPVEQLGNLPAMTCDSKTYSTGEGQKARYGVFSSAHPGGVQFAFCDGSVRMLHRGQTWVLGSPDWYLFQQLAGFHDGFHRDTSEILP